MVKVEGTRTGIMFKKKCLCRITESYAMQH